MHFVSLALRRPEVFSRGLLPCCPTVFQGIIHGDLKPLNAVRVRDKWKLIDLDAAAHLSGGFVGLKSSTAVRLRIRCRSDTD